MGGAEVSERVTLVSAADGPFGPPVIRALLGAGRFVLAGGSSHAALAEIGREGVVPLTLRSTDPGTLRVALAVAMDRFGGLDDVLLLDGLGEEPGGPGGVSARLAALVAWVEGLTAAALVAPVRVRVVVAPLRSRGDAGRPWGATADAAVATWIAAQRASLSARGLRLSLLEVSSEASEREWGRRLDQGDVEGRVRGLARRLRGVSRARTAS